MTLGPRPRTVCLVLFLAANPAVFTVTSPTQQQWSVSFSFPFCQKNKQKKNGQIWVFQENVGFSRTCRTVQLVKPWSMVMLGKKSPSDALWDGVMQSGLLTILFKFKMWYNISFHPYVKVDANYTYSKAKFMIDNWSCTLNADQVLISIYALLRSHCLFRAVWVIT